nr:GxxExxY protein [uncultured Mucilaginibacter sp.]
MKVHNNLGNGFQEVIYQRALAIEFRIAGINYEREKEMSIYYYDELIGTRRAVFLLKKV